MTNSKILAQDLAHKLPLARIVVLTGAGISAESGIKTFRAADGLWEEHRIEDVAAPAGFVRNPDLVHQFYNDRRRQLLSGIQPNAGHMALAEFANNFAGTFTLITQNIDDLHERAGSSRVLHMHGELLRMRCNISQQLFDWEVDSYNTDRCQCCDRSGTLRPHVVWFGEMPLFMEEIYAALCECDVFIAIGTSGNVYPAAGFFDVARQAGALTVELNLEPSANASAFAHAVYGPATKIVPTFFRELHNLCLPK